MSNKTKDDNLPQKKWDMDDLDEIVRNAENGTREGPQKPPTKVDAEVAPRRSFKEAFEVLDQMAEEAKGGMSTEQLADRAKVSRVAVREWRKSRRIPEPSPAAEAERARALRLSQADDWTVLQYVRERVDEAAIEDGSWEPVEFVLRRPIDYTEFTRHVFFLHTRMGSSVEMLAEAFGVRVKDIELAVGVERHHLTKVGVPCSGCTHVVDPRYGKYCSYTCKAKRK
jgi:transcriptional regulator with XRE-family HTH domain